MAHSNAGYRAFDDIEATISAVKAFGQMVGMLLDSGDNHSRIAFGVEHLLESQCDRLESQAQDLRATLIAVENQRTESTPAVQEKTLPGADYYKQNQKLIAQLNAEGRSEDEIAALTGLGRDRVRVFLQCMPEQIQDAVADPRALRASFIVEKTGEGYDAGEIANALNLKRTTVERVINRLLGLDDNVAGVSAPNRAVNE